VRVLDVPEGHCCRVNEGFCLADFTIWPFAHSLGFVKVRRSVPGADLGPSADVKSERRVGGRQFGSTGMRGLKLVL